VSILDDLLSRLREAPHRRVCFDPADAQALAVLAVAGRATVADQVRDADLIDRLAAALAVLLHAAVAPAGIDPMAWLQANTALAAAGRDPIAPPADHRARWLASMEWSDR
jgi:hypothetical protein